MSRSVVEKIFIPDTMKVHVGCEYKSIYELSGSVVRVEHYHTGFASHYFFKYYF